MPAPSPHALPVNADHALWPAENLRELRLALDMIRLFLPVGDPGPARDDPASDLIDDLHVRLCAEEDKELRATGAPSRYLIIRPVNPLNPPPPCDMDRITAAIRTLASLGMLAGRGDTSQTRSTPKAATGAQGHPPSRGS